MNSTITVRILNDPSTQDWKDSILLHNRVFSESPGFEEYSAEIALEKMKGVNNVAIVTVYSGKTLVGYAFCYERYPNYWHIWQLGVEKAHRNQGLASMIYNAVELRAKELGYEGITLNTFNAHEDNIRLVLRRGYEIYDLEKSGTHSDNPKIMLKLTF